MVPRPRCRWSRIACRSLIICNQRRKPKARENRKKGEKEKSFLSPFFLLFSILPFSVFPFFHPSFFCNFSFLFSSLTFFPFVPPSFFSFPLVYSSFLLVYLFLSLIKLWIFPSAERRKLLSSHEPNCFCLV